eukprot:8103069-Pyramimonas_sp.AAC.1
MHKVPSSATKEWSDSLKLAWGACPCELGQGPRGIPVCKVERRPGEENIDLLPLGWLWKRGCECEMEAAGP